MTPEGKGYKPKDNPIKKPKSKLKRKAKKAGKY